MFIKKKTMYEENYIYDGYECVINVLDSRNIIPERKMGSHLL